MRRLVALYTRWPRVLAALAIVLPVLIFYLPLILGLRTFPDGDFVQHFFPFSLVQYESLRALHLPQWLPNTFAGHPFLADTQAAVFYPISNLVLALTLPVREAAARFYLLQGEAILQTALAGLFMALLVRTITGVRWAAVLAGLTFALSGYLTAYPPLQLAVLRTAIWLPLILWLSLQAYRAPRMGRRPWGWALGAGVALAVAFFAGHPQTYLYIGYTTAAWVLLLSGTLVSSGARAVVRFVMAALLAALVAAGLSMVQLLPSLEFTRYSVRAATDYAFAAGGFPLRDTWQMLLPGILTQYSPLYVGLPALALGIMAVAATMRPVSSPDAAAMPVRAITWFFVGLALFALFVSFGENGPIFGMVYRLLPGWGFFRGQERAAYLVALSLSVLAGMGAAALPGLPARLRRRSALLVGAVAIGCTYGAGLLLQLPGRSAVGNGEFLLIALVAILIASATALTLWLPGRDQQRPAALLALTVIGLFAANFGINFDRATLGEKVVQPPEVLALQQALSESTEAGMTGRVYNEYRVVEDYGIRAGVEDLWGSSPLRLATYAPFAEEFPLDRWWSLTGVTHVLTWRQELFVPSALLDELPQENDTTYLHALTNPAPRAWLTTGVAVASDDEARRLLADHTFPLTSTVVLPPETGITERAPTPDSPPATITMVRPSPERIDLDVSSSGGVLVVSENWMPGWRLEVTRSEASAAIPRLVRANLSFLGVVLPAGSFSLNLRYAPQSLSIGLWTSVVSLFVLILVALFLLITGRRRGAE